jgi:putative tricarboxylic transport membrane protein
VPVSIQGGGGIPAIAQWQRRPTDGYTIMAISPAQIISHVQGRIDMADFMPLARVQFDQALIWVPADSPFETVQDMVAFAEENPGAVSVAISGAGGFDEVAVSLFGLEADVQFTTVPFSSSEMVSNTVGGQVDAMFEEFGPARGLWESGDLRPLVLFSEARLPVLPEVPTALELDYNVTLGRWRAFAMQASDNPAQAQRMYELVEQAVETEGYKEYEQQSALQYRSELIGLDDFQSFIDSEIETYTAVMKQLGYIE